MGWNSGTEYIEIIHDILYSDENYGRVPPDVSYELLSRMWDALRDGDWDVQDEFIEGVESSHKAKHRHIPDELMRLFAEKGYSRVRDRATGRAEWVSTDSLEYYNLKEYELA